MTHAVLIDGNNLGHALGYIDKQADRYDTAGLLACLDDIARHLVSQGQEAEVVLFLDDANAAERRGGWHVKVASVPEGNADDAIRAFAQAHTGRPQTLVSADSMLCDDAAVWGAICLSPDAFISNYLVPARAAGYCRDNVEAGPQQRESYVEVGQDTPPIEQVSPSPSQADQGAAERKNQDAALKRAEATLRGDTPRPPEVFILDLRRWSDTAELALYLAERHLCPEHSDLTDPHEMIATIREHCCIQPRYFTAGRVIDRVFRLFLCRRERSLSLDDLARLAQTRRRKIRAAISRQGERLGIMTHW